MPILVDASLVMLAIGIPAMLDTIVFTWWFRASNARGTYRRAFTYSGCIEPVVWSISLMVLLLLGDVRWIGCYQLDPAGPTYYNGDGSATHFMLSAVTPEQFAAWVAHTREAGPTLDLANHPQDALV